MVPLRSKDPGVLCAMLTRIHQETLPYGLANGRRKILMDHAGIKEEFKSYLRNAGPEDFEANKCPQYHDLTSSFVRRFEYSSSRNSPSVMFDLYDKSIPWT